MDPVFEASAEGINEGIGAALSYYQQKNLMRQQQRYTKENMKLAQEMQQTDRQIAPLQSAEAMERAGLSSTLLTDGKFQLAGVTNHPGAAAPAPTYHYKGVDVAALEQQRASVEAQTAQADLLRAQAEKTRVETGEVREEQNAVNVATRAYLEGVSKDDKIDPSVRNRAKVMLGLDGIIGRATLEGIRKHIDFVQADRQSIVDMLENAIQVKIRQLGLEHDVAQLQIDSQFSDYDKKELEVAKLLAEKAYIDGQAENLGSERSENLANAKALLAQAAKTEHSDLIALLDNPDDMEKLKNLGTKVFEGGLALAPYGLMLTAGKGVKGVTTLGKELVQKVKKFVGRKGTVAVKQSVSPLSRMPASLKKTLDDKAFETEVLTRLPEKVRRKAYAEYLDLRRFRNYKGSFGDFLKQRDQLVGNPNKNIHR